MARHRDPTRDLRRQLHRPGAAAHLRQLPGGLAAGAGRGARAAHPGVAGQPRARRRCTLGLVWLLGARLYTRARRRASRPCSSRCRRSLPSTRRRTSRTRFCGALLLGAACLAAREDRTPWWVPVSIGLLLGWAVLARYFTGVVCAVPIVLWLLRPGVSRARTARAGPARRPALDRRADGLQRRAERQPVAAHDHAADACRAGSPTASCCAAPTSSRRICCATCCGRRRC